MRTTKAQFKRFKNEFNRWVIKFGLLDYHIEFFHQNLSDDAYAEIDVRPNSCVASVWYNKNLSDVVSPEPPEHAAKHEAIHLLIARLSVLASVDVIEQVTVENERIVRILEKLLR